MSYKILITAAVVGGAIGMILIGATQHGSFITALMWIGAFLLLFLLPKKDSEEDEG